MFFNYASLNLNITATLRTLQGFWNQPSLSKRHLWALYQINMGSKSNPFMKSSLWHVRLGYCLIKSICTSDCLFLIYLQQNFPAIYVFPIISSCTANISSCWQRCSQSGAAVSVNACEHTSPVCVCGLLH